MNYPGNQYVETKKELAHRIALEADCTPRLALRLLDALGAVIYDAMIRGERVRIPHLGHFYPLAAKARLRKDMYRGEWFQSKATIQIKFKCTRETKLELVRVVERAKRAQKRATLAREEFGEIAEPETRPEDSPPPAPV